MALELRQSNLEQLADEVGRPRYQRGNITAGIVHIGVGNFHRAHLGVYLNRLFQRNADHDWGIVGAGIREGDKSMRATLEQQDWLTTIIELDPDVDTAFVTGAMIDFIDVNAQKIVDRLCDPIIRIVSLTITEGGYYVNASTNQFDQAHADIRADGANTDSPETVFGILVAAIKRRKAAGIAPFTVMSCDNLPGNGHVTRAAVVGVAKLQDQELAQWIEKNVAFPNSMVDCITPATSDLERELVRNRYGIIDNWPVACESFRQWVLEDNFPSGRPSLELVDVQFVDDVIPFELMKLRILNGGHAAIAYPAALLDIHYVHEAMLNPLVRSYLDKLEHDEIIPAVPPVPDTDLAGYYEIVARRFANPMINDTIQRLCQDGSSRQPKFIVPTIRQRRKSDQSVDGLALESALWCRYCAGTSDSGKPIELDDKRAGQLREAATASRDNPLAFVQQRDIYGDLSDDASFCASFAAAIGALWAEGTATTLQRYVNNQTL